MEKLGKYELLYIVHPDLEASIDKITDKIKNSIESRKGKISYEENWGKRKLAYPIRKSDVGIYVLVYFESPAEALSKVERDIRLTEEVMRFMILATTDKIGKKEKRVAKETPAKEEKTEVKKSTPKKKEAEKVENEEERMKQIDEKLDAILGEEGDNKEDKVKETK